MSNNFRYQSFVVDSGSLARRVPVFDDFLSSHEQEIYPTTSFNENCIEFEFQTDRNFYVNFRQSYLAVELKFVKSCGYETYFSKKKRKEQEEEAKAEEETDEVGEAPVPLLTHFALNFFQCSCVHQQSAKLQIKWTLCAQVLHFHYFQGTHL